MPKVPLRWPVRTSIAVAVVVAVASCVGYIKSSDGWCAECGTRFWRNEVGLVVPWDAPNLRVAAWNTPSPPSVAAARWFPPDHRHDEQWSFSSNDVAMLGIVQSHGHGHRMPGPFVLAVSGEDGFADFIDAEIAGGRVDVQTVRALCAMRGGWCRDYEAVRDSGVRALRRRGCELAGTLRGVPPAETGLWGSEPWENGFGEAPPPSAGRPGPRLSNEVPGPK